MLKLHYVFCITVLWATSLCAQPDQVKNEPLTVKVLCFNIRYDNSGDKENAWPHRKDFAVDLMARGDYDFINMQEVLIRPNKERCQLEQIKRGLSEKYDVIVRSRETEENSGESMPIFYRKDRWELDEKEHGIFWLSETPDKVGSLSWDSACRRVVTYGLFRHRQTQKTCVVINTHFDHVSEKARQRSAVLITNRLLRNEKLTDMPIIFTGDFNVGEEAPVIRYFQGKGAVRLGSELFSLPSEQSLTDTFRAVYPDGPEQGTFHGFTGTPGKSRIDFIFVSKNIIPTAASIIRTEKDGRYPSDHFPVDATLLLR